MYPRIREYTHLFINRCLLLYVHLFTDHRTIAGFHKKLAFTDEVAVAVFAEMNFQVFDADGIAIGYVGDVGMQYFMPVDDHHQSAPDRFHLIAPGDEHTGILAQADANAGWVGGHGLGQANKAAAFFVRERKADLEQVVERVLRRMLGATSPVVAPPVRQKRQQDLLLDDTLDVPLVRRYNNFAHRCAARS